MSVRKSNKALLVVLVTLAIIGAWTVIDNTWRLGCAIGNTVTHFNYHPAHIVAQR
jgi:hypothetical protein